MKPRGFHIVLGISLVAVAILAIGFVGVIGVTVCDNSGTSSAPLCRLRTYEIRDGRVMISTIVSRSARGPVMPPGRSYRRFGRIFPPRFASPGHAIAGFDYHAMVTVGGPSGSFLVSCPTWCFAIPFLLAPSIWFWKWRSRQHRQRQDVRGFPVGQS